MTDNQIESPNQQPANGQTQTNALADSNPLNNTTKPGSKNKNTPEPQIKKWILPLLVSPIRYTAR